MEYGIDLLSVLPTIIWRRLTETTDVALANTVAVMFQYLGGAIGLAVAGIICRNSLATQLRNEPQEKIVRYLN